MSSNPPPTFNNEEISDLKRLAIAGLLSGSLTASLKYLRPGALFGSKPQVIGSPFVEVPVPGQEPLPNTSEFFEKIRKKKNVAKGKRLQTFKPGSKVSIKDDSEEKKAFSYNSFTNNAAYLPAAALALIAPAVGSYHLLNKIHKERLKKDHAEELEDAKREFGEALVEAHANRLKKPVVIDNSLGKVASNQIPTMADDLEKLASLCLDEKSTSSGLKKQADSRFADAANAIFNAISIPVKGIGTGLDWFGKAMSDPSKPLRAYANLLGGLAVGGGLIGATTGYRDAVKNDEEKLQSERYLNEFLARRQNEGMPVQSMPVPVKQVGNRLIAKPLNIEST